MKDNLRLDGEICDICREAYVEENDGDDYIRQCNSCSSKNFFFFLNK